MALVRDPTASTWLTWLVYNSHSPLSLSPPFPLSPRNPLETLKFCIAQTYCSSYAAIPKSILDEAQNIADTLHAAIIHKLTKRVHEVLSSGNYDQLGTSPLTSPPLTLPSLTPPRTSSLTPLASPSRLPSPLLASLPSPLSPLPLSLSLSLTSQYVKTDCFCSGAVAGCQGPMDLLE